MELIDRLVAEAAAEAAEKEYCDSEMAKTEEKKTELEDDVAKLTAKIDNAAATSAKLRKEVKELQQSSQSSPSCRLRWTRSGRS